MYSELARSICAPRDRQPTASGHGARRVGNFKSAARRRDVVRRTADRVNAATGVVTVAEQLRERGANDDIVRRYASPVGRKTAEAWRKAHGADPEQTGLAAAGRHGRSRLVAAFGYPADARPVLDTVIDAYELADPNAPKGRKAPRVRLVDLIGA